MSTQTLNDAIEPKVQGRIYVDPLTRKLFEMHIAIATGETHTTGYNPGFVLIAYQTYLNTARIDRNRNPVRDAVGDFLALGEHHLTDDQLDVLENQGDIGYRISTMLRRPEMRIPQEPARGFTQDLYPDDLMTGEQSVYTPKEILEIDEVERMIAEILGLSER